MVIRNNKAALHWCFALAALLFLASISVVLIDSGGSKVYSTLTLVSVLTAFWVGGLVLAAYALRQACVTLVVNPGASVTVTWRYPFKNMTRVVPVSDLSPAVLIESRDAEGGVYFRSRLALPDGLTIDLAETRRRQVCVSLCKGFNEAVWSVGVNADSGSSFRSAAPRTLVS